MSQEQLSDARILYTACPLCESESIERYSDEDCSWHALYKPALPPVIHWVRCTRCGHNFSNGYFSAAALEVLFSDTHSIQMPEGDDVEASRYRSAEVIERMEQLRGYRQGRWLDVGFGNGSLLVTAAEFGWQVVGLDLRETSVQQIRARGVEAYATDLAEFESSDPFDVISFADVLEHMPYPKPALIHTRTLLAPDGHVFISMPNKDCYPWRDADSRGANPYWGELEHYHNFGRARLYDLLEECGFRPVRYTVNLRYRFGMEVVATLAD